MMKAYLRLAMLMCLTLPAGMSMASGTSWTCTSQDSGGYRWTYSSSYQKVALNQAYLQCKKQSAEPKSCKSEAEACHYFIDGLDATPMWQCTAVDAASDAYNSTLYNHQDDAALGALAYCKKKSPVPDTCFINTITCTNVNDRTMH